MELKMGDIIKKLKEFSNQWKKLGHIPRDKMKINDEFFDLINAKFEELGLSKKVLAEEKDIASVFLVIVIETNDARLKLAKWMRRARLSLHENYSANRATEISS